MTEPRIARLSNRHRDVLRGVAALRKTKQIAADLGIAPGTVDGYIAEAVRILGAVDRGDAARMFAKHECVDDRPIGDPGHSGGQSPWVSASASPVTELRQPVIDPEVSRDAGTVRPATFSRLLPIRRAGQRSNDLPVVARLLWIPAIAVILAIGFGMLASGLTVLAELIERLGRLSG
ncbi:helix-turn-helix domain-containing protein [Sphingomonas faeni]|uniref:helix-turn-helix domain-containing protein n=1 Tax=Sphingomonas faeni TaxID=185950 RepID=UPI0020BD5282|nr:helix-turn-helix transcriptional regulator [Sphingomonas faeni]MCK8457590.1 helix-turn-helix transcriptional regulator [Sphingomonas faeni]